MPRTPEVNFYLKPVGPDGKSLIFLNFKYSNNRLFYSFGEKISPSDWNPKKQRAKKKATTTIDGEYSLNDLLENLKEVCEKAYKNEKVEGIPTPEKLKGHLNAFLHQNLVDEPKVDPFFTLIDRFIAGEIKHKGKDKSKNTLQNYQTVKGHLQAYEAKRKVKITFESITLDFFYDFVGFLKSLNLAQNTIAKDITVLKVFMGEAIDLGYTNNIAFRHKKFTVEEEETDAVYLTEAEINTIYRLDLAEFPRLEKVRDLFIFGCYVGLRYSDYSTIQPENIVNIEGDFFIKIITSKTKELVIIPCSPEVMEIFEKYSYNKNNLPGAPSNQKFNEYIKEVCKKATLTEKGRLSTRPEQPLYECISSHTARRSFATNLYLDGYPTIEIMKITGHRTEKAFMKYIRVSKLDAARRLSAHMKKRWSEKMLKVS